MGNQVSPQEIGLKAKELKWFNAARAVCSIFPSSEPEQPEPPAPDIRFPHLRLGIEITEYLTKQNGGSPRKRLEGQRHKIVDEAKRLFETICDARLFVSISWTSRRMLSADLKDAVVREIVRVVRNLLTQGEQTWRPNWLKSEDQVLGMHIGDISVNRPTRGPNNWVLFDAGMVGGDIERVQATISGKEPRLAKYRTSCINVWLLIVADIAISTYFSPDADFDTAVFTSDFDRVLMFDIFKNQVRELRLASILQPTVA
jgi:hypothetical protein